jgi:hypothetical protein
VSWVNTTLNNGTARFTTNVWLVSAYVNKLCQFVQPGTKPTYDYIPGGEEVAVTMTLRVYGVEARDHVRMLRPIGSSISEGIALSKPRAFPACFCRQCSPLSRR